MPGLTKPITHWEIMNEPEFKLFFKGTEEDFVEIFNFSSKTIKAKQGGSIGNKFVASIYGGCN